MTMAVVSFSAFPVLFKLGGADVSPFLFTGVYQASIGIGMGAVILLLYRKLLLMPAVRKDIGSQCQTWLMFISVIGFCGFALFALGLVFIDVSIAAILYEIWPLFLMLIIARLFNDSERYRPITGGTLIYLVPAILGVALVVLSQNDSPQLLPGTGVDWISFRTLLGIILVLMAVLCQAAHGGGTLKLGTLLAKRHSHTKNQEAGEIVFVMVMTCIGQTIAGGVLFAIGLILSETLSMHQFWYAILSGFVVTSIGTVAFRFANLKTDNLGVNAIAFATPMVALIWLWMFSILGVAHLDYLIIGAMGIVASNLLINVDASSRVAYKALVVSLWLFGTVIYLTEGYATDVPLELPVTVFILVLAFRVDRLVRRTGQEEEWVFDVFHRLRLMAGKFRNDASSDKAMNADQHQTAAKVLLKASKTLLRIDNHKNTMDLAAEYRNMVEYLNKALKAGGDADEISSIRRMVDKLSHSRQQGSRLGEIVAIFLAGALIVFGLLVFSGEREVYGEITSFVLSSVVVFLFFNILDLQKDREDETMVEGDIKEYEDGEFIVNFANATNRKKQQYISMATSCVIVIVFACLFFAKA